ncbi:MmpS family transport accessory protein [Aeromicrobium camelliae]|nr:MmpS family transport accessory protein [Aeromicrobium camelliae]
MTQVPPPPAGPQQPAGYYPPQQPPKKKRGFLKWAGIALGAVVLLSIVGAALSGGDDTDASSGSDTAETNREEETQADPAAQEEAAEPAPENVLRYEVTTSTGAPLGMVTYMSTDFNISQEANVPSGWSKEVQFDSKLDAMGANMNAQNSGGGDVTCRVFWDGELVNENTSSGEFAMVTCSLPN